MIVLTRLNGTPLGVNADLIERIDVTPDTVVTLVDGKKFVVTEPMGTVIARVVAFRASVLAATEAQVLAGATPAGPPYGGAPHVAGAPAARPLRLLTGAPSDLEGEA
ncbi:MAG: flagellar protein FlbD [Acidimicrobiia bacterium]|nr:flagellar protein FlbD [Acidimicrobiia bacterium]